MTIENKGAPQKVVIKGDEGYYFFSENWQYYGPFNTEELAHIELYHYKKTLEMHKRMSYV